MKKTAIFPGSFDPITIGHERLIRRALPLFDELIVVVGVNVRKQCRYALDQRMDWIRCTFADCPNITVDYCEELTVDYCRSHGARYIVRGLRNDTDFNYEAEAAKVNRMLEPSVETVMMLSDPFDEIVSSSTVRELLNFGRDVREFLPKPIRKDF